MHPRSYSYNTNDSSNLEAYGFYNSSIDKWFEVWTDDNYSEEAQTRA